MSLIKKILHAKNRIEPFVVQTGLEFSTAISRHLGAKVWLKCEHLQRTGSFKIRGALNKILALSHHDKNKGIVAASSGNHGKAVAKACKITQAQATIFVPKNAAQVKVQAMKDLGAKVCFVEGECLLAESDARKYALKKNQVFISPYNDIDVIAGQGTIGVELANQCSNIDAIFISVGGGGLISGVATYLKSINPKIKIIGCWPHNAQAMYQCLKAQKIIFTNDRNTISDGTAGGVEPGAITFNLCQDLIDGHVLVSEKEIARAMRMLAEHESYIIEGSAGVALAGLINLARNFAGKNIVAVLCGRNISLDIFLSAMQNTNMKQACTSDKSSE